MKKTTPFEELITVLFFCEVIMTEYSNIFYLKSLSKIGGVETFIYELAKKYDYDMALYYSNADDKQIERLIKLIPCIPYLGQKIKCKRIFLNNDTDILDTAEYEYVIQMIHGLYKTNMIEPNVDLRVNRRIAVSQAAANEYFELTGIKADVYHNPITLTEEDREKVLYLISATRLTSEKGGDRMLKLAKLLEKNNLKYIWIIFTNDKVYEFTNNMVKLKPTLDIRPYISSIKGKGYGVQLSDCEGDCYFTKECLSFGVPVLVTPVKSFEEQGIINGKTGYYLSFNMDNIDINKIFNEIPKFDSIIFEDKWNKLFIHKKSNYKEEINMKFKVRALPTFKEMGLAPKELGDNNIPEAGYEFEVDKMRLDILLGNNAYGVAFVELIDEVKNKTEEEKPKKVSKKK